MTRRPSPDAPATGRCRCGRIVFEVAKPPLITMACHCTGCQRMTASAFSLSAAIPAEGFRVMEGEPAIGGLHGELEHFCCSRCMSWLFTRIPAAQSMINVRSPMLEGADWKEPFVETWTSEKLPWATTPARHSFPGFPPQEAWPRMIAEFQAEFAGGASAKS